jgi:hypothetical protein
VTRWAESGPSPLEKINAAYQPIFGDDYCRSLLKNLAVHQAGPYTEEEEER